MTDPTGASESGQPVDPLAELGANVDRAAAILVRSTQRVKREVLAAKIRLARNQRSKEVDDEISRVATEFAARSAFKSGARLESSWAAALKGTRTAAETIVTACLANDPHTKNVRREV